MGKEAKSMVIKSFRKQVTELTKEYKLSVTEEQELPDIK